MNKIRGFKIKLRKREILRKLKYSKNIAINSDLENTIQKQIEKAYLLIYPSVIYETYSKNTKEFEIIQKDILLDSKKVEILLKGAVAFTLMAATIGLELEKEVDVLKESNLTEAFILDAIGSEGAEQCANFVSKIIKEEAIADECNLSMRFSPGYGDWQIVASEKILKLVDAEKISVKIKQSSILLPRKSITALQSWQPN